MCVVFNTVECCRCSKINGSEGSATLIPLIVLCFFWPHLGCNPSAWSLQVVPAVIKDRIRRELDSGNPILSWSFSCVILLAVSTWTVMLSIRPVLWSCLGDVKPLWPHFLPLLIIMKGFWRPYSLRQRKLKELCDSREFFFSWTYYKQKKSISFIEKTSSFYHTYWMQRFVLTQLWERQGPRKGGHGSWKTYCIDKEKGSCMRESSENPSPSYAVCMLLALLFFSERFLLRKLTKFSVLLERQILNSVSSFRILLYECG